MVFIYLEFFLFPSLGNVPENWGMAQNPSLGEFGKEPEGSRESDRLGLVDASVGKYNSRTFTVYEPENEKLNCIGDFGSSFHYISHTLCICIM